MFESFKEIMALLLGFMGLLVTASAVLLIICAILSPTHKGLILFMGIFLGIGGVIMMIKGKYELEISKYYE